MPPTPSPASLPAGLPVIRAIFQGPPSGPQTIITPQIQISARLEAALATPTWSVRSLLPPASSASATSSASSSPTTTSHELKSTSSSKAAESSKNEITPQKLHHLLRLSALPLPKTAEDESVLLKTLRAQLHFVRAVQSVDTTGVEPLRSIRDETAEAREEETVGLEEMKSVLGREERVGWARRIVKRQMKGLNVGSRRGGSGEDGDKGLLDGEEDGKQKQQQLRAERQRQRQQDQEGEGGGSTEAGMVDLGAGETVQLDLVREQLKREMHNTQLAEHWDCFALSSHQHPHHHNRKSRGASSSSSPTEEMSTDQLDDVDRMRRKGNMFVVRRQKKKPQQQQDR